LFYSRQTDGDCLEIWYLLCRRRGKIMKKVSLEEIMAWGPCASYTRERVTELLAGRHTVAAHDVRAANIPTEDKLWFVVHCLSEPQQHEFACRVAERVLYLCDDPRPRRAIETKRAWLRGEIDDNELAAARTAARTAARDAARDAWDTMATAMDAARDTMSTAMDAARAVGEKLSRIRSVL